MHIVKTAVACFALACCVGVASPTAAQDDMAAYGEMLKAANNQIFALQNGGIPLDTTTSDGKRVKVVVPRDAFVNGLTLGVLDGDIALKDISGIVRSADARRRSELAFVTGARNHILKMIEDARSVPPRPVISRPQVFPRREPIIVQPQVFPRREPVITQPQVGSAWMTGNFNSTFGRMTFGPGGGTYDSPAGSYLGVTSIKGTVVEGNWQQQRSAKLCPSGGYRGKFHFEFTASGFSGRWGYCESDSDGGGWSGTRVN